MKNIFRLLSIVFLFTLVSCGQNEYDPVKSAGDGFVLRGNVAYQTKTSFGKPSNGTIPFIWDEGDIIQVNGNDSEPLSEGGTFAEFIFESGSVASGDEVFYGYVDGDYLITLPYQTGKSKNIDGDFGYAVVNENNEFILQHYTSYIWLYSFTEDIESPVSKVVISAENDIVGMSEFNPEKKTFGNISSSDPKVDLLAQTKSIEIEFQDDNRNPEPKSLLEESSNTEFWALAVTFPVTTGNVRIDYYFDDGKMATFTYPSNTLVSGNTYKISQEITKEDLYELRVLTFEDEPYSSYWANLIPGVDEQAYGASSLIYGPDGYGGLDEPYKWYDENTKLSHCFPENYGIYNFAGGGYVISTHQGTMEQLVAATDQYEYQLSIPLANGHNGSENFCIGYHDSWLDKTDDIKPALYFQDGTPRIIDHMYITNASITMYCMLYGNSFSDAYDADDYLRIVATGYTNDVKGKTVSYTLAEGAEMKVDTWVKWDLSALGKVDKVVFHMEEHQLDDYGYAKYTRTPMYFALDDVAVRFEE